MKPTENTLLPVNHSETNHLPGSADEGNKPLFLLADFAALLYVCIAIVTITGNALVLYASYDNKNSGPLRYLDNAVKSLAMADMLFGLLGVPCKLSGSYLGGYIDQPN